MINAFINESKFPSHLKQAITTPVFKKGDVEDQENNRPISIISAISKVFERLLANQINQYLRDSDLIGHYKFGFQAKISTTDADVNCTGHFRIEIDKNKFVTCALLDLSTAFDSIQYNSLYRKLFDIGFDESSISLLLDFTTDRMQKVCVNSTQSDWIKL